MTQKQRILDYITRYGSITPLDAFIDLGITKLATVISSMKREDGIVFYQNYEKSYNRFGEKVYYMRYWTSLPLFMKHMSEYSIYVEKILGDGIK